MKALNRKLLRDLARMPAQAATIALVVALGIASYLASMSALHSIVSSRDRYYAATGFADVFARVVRAPRTLLPRLEAIEGVAQVDARVTQTLRVEVEGFGEPAHGVFVSVEPAAGLNRLTLVSGHRLERDDEVLVSQQFARAHHLEPQDLITAIVNGRRMRLKVAGVALSPEYVWVLTPGAFWSDDLRNGVFWMTRDALQTALGFEDAFNDLALSLAPGAARSVPAVIDAVDRLLEPYGSFGAHGRDKQPSNRLVSDELAQLKGMAAFLPLIFLGVASFLVNLVISRVVAAQREQIAGLKALGYSNLQVGQHYALLALTILGAGTLAGLALGGWAGHALVGLYTRYFHFPVLAYRLELPLAASACALTVGAGLLGALGAVTRVVRLAPAEAMRPEAPAVFRPTLLDRIEASRLLPVGLRMVLRDLLRQPVRLALSSAAIALSTAILVAGNASIDSITRLFELQFSRVQREELEVSFARPQGAAVQRAIAGLPGVFRVELERLAPVRLRVAHRSREAVLRSVPADGQLRQIIDRRGGAQRIPPSGVAISAALGRLLGVAEGGAVELELLQGGRERRTATVTALIDDALGLSAYIEAEHLQQLLGETALADGMLLAVDPTLLGEVERRLAALPAVSSLVRPEQAQQLFKQQVTEVVSLYQWVLALCAGAIAIGVVYNNARIALAARSRDLATLRILGFTRGEVLSVLAGEQAAQLTLGIPAGLVLGQLLARALYARLNPELYRIWIEVTSNTRALAATVVLLAGALSLLAVRRGVRKLNLVSVLKARD